MPDYKLYYFDGRGTGEVIRQLFHLANIPFEDVRIPMDKWPELKSKMPFGQMPVLEVDGQQIPQSAAIARYVAKLTDRTGMCPFEQAIVDALADQFKDYYAQISPYYYTATGLRPATVEEVEKHRKETLMPNRDVFFGYLLKYLQKSRTGFLAGGGLTFADLLIAEHVSTIKGLYSEYTNGFPEIEAHLQKVHNVPALKKWLDVRPITAF